MPELLYLRNSFSDTIDAQFKNLEETISKFSIYNKVLSFPNLNCQSSKTLGPKNKAPFITQKKKKTGRQIFRTKMKLTKEAAESYQYHCNHER